MSRIRPESLAPDHSESSVAADVLLRQGPDEEEDEEEEEEDNGQNDDEKRDEDGYSEWARRYLCRR